MEPTEPLGLSEMVSKALAFANENAIIAFGFTLALVLAALLRNTRRRPARRGDNRRRRQPGAGARPDNWIVVDGSNVMHWQDETPKLETVIAVVRKLEAQGFAPGVVFDANAGHKLGRGYLGEREFAKLLRLPRDRLFVVPKGSPADPYILSAATDYGTRIVTRDRYRDWAESYPQVLQPGLLVRGGYRDSGELWLDEASLAPKATPTAG